MGSTLRTLTDRSAGGALRDASETVQDRTNGRNRRRMGYVRLRGDYYTFREEFDALVAAATDAGVTEFFWKEDVLDLFERVEDALERGRIADGWRHFHGARRIETYGLEALDEATGSNELEARARTLRREALEVLGGWRRTAVEELLGRDGLDADVTGAAVRQAHAILNEQYESVHLRRDYLQLQFKQLFRLGLVGSILFVLLAALPYFVDEGVPWLGSFVAFLESPFAVVVGPGAGTQPDVSSLGFALFVGLAGIVGASLFGMRSLRDERLSMKVAQQLTGLTVTWARGLFGAIGALVVYFALQTPFMSVGENTAAVMIVVGFAAGYSERLVTRALETVSGASK
ncbi:hypothetical protein [Haloplanus halophilus]|uniref:hypothetical protein n=1 Tax=Haloplanus halophilus TaxID=2949993 RepID=UPI00203DD1F5|nr:hypothetical protein [Haloplanus sp. GDY1]